MRNLKLAILALSLAVLAGCAAVEKDVEMPKNSGTGADEMKPSPCACQRLDFDGRGFTWLS